MKWPLMFRSTHEKLLAEQQKAFWKRHDELNLYGWKEWAVQVKQTRAAQKGLLRLQRRLRRILARNAAFSGPGATDQQSSDSLSPGSAATHS